ncbi:MAG: hypothetical protein ACSLEL_01490 [Candidatus Malihini olakiniferum]
MFEAIPHQEILCIVGTFIGCIGALVILVSTILAFVVIFAAVLCILSGFCTCISLLGKLESTYYHPTHVSSSMT